MLGSFIFHLLISLFVVEVPSSSQHAPLFWNNVPYSLQHTSSTASFKSALKTHLFPFKHWIDHCMAHLFVCVVCVCVCVYVVCVCVRVHAYMHVCVCMLAVMRENRWSVAVCVFVPIINGVSLFFSFCTLLLTLLFCIMRFRLTLVVDVV